MVVSSLRAMHGDSRTTFFVSQAFMQKLPDQTAELMGNRADRLGVPRRGPSRRYTS
jgi:hypothetical protein